MTDTNHTRLDDMSKALVSDMIGIYMGDSNAVEALEDATKARKDATSNSIRALGTRLGAINWHMTGGEIDDVAIKVATKLAGGNANTLKSRKSEIKLALTQRAHISGVIVAFDAHVKLRDPKQRSLHIRQAVTGALRRLRDCEADNAPKAFDQWRVKYDKVVPASVKVARAITSMMSNSELMVKDTDGNTVLHPACEWIAEAINAAMEGHQGMLDNLSRKASKRSETTVAPDVEAAALALIKPVGLNKAALEPMPALKPLATPIPEPAKIADAEFDLDAVISGIL